MGKDLCVDDGAALPGSVRQGDDSLIAKIVRVGGLDRWIGRGLPEEERKKGKEVSQREAPESVSDWSLALVEGVASTFVSVLVTNSFSLPGVREDDGSRRDSQSFW
jgi:hypothetical protein